MTFSYGTEEADAAHLQAMNDFRRLEPNYQAYATEDGVSKDVHKAVYESVFSQICANQKVEALSYEHSKLCEQARSLRDSAFEHVRREMRKEAGHAEKWELVPGGSVVEIDGVHVRAIREAFEAGEPRLSLILNDKEIIFLNFEKMGSFSISQANTLD